MALGVDEVIRETWLSSLAMARDTLRAMGVRKADRYVDRFAEHDEATLREQVAHRGDHERLARIERKKVASSWRSCSARIDACWRRIKRATDCMRAAFPMVRFRTD